MSRDQIVSRVLEKLAAEEGLVRGLASDTKELVLPQTRTEKNRRRDALVAGGLAGTGVGAGTALNSYVLAHSLNEMTNDRAEKSQQLLQNTARKFIEGIEGPNKKGWRARFVRDRLGKAFGLPHDKELGKLDYSGIGQDARDLIPKAPKKQLAKAGLAAGVAIGIPTAMAVALGAKALMDRERTGKT